MSESELATPVMLGSLIRTFSETVAALVGDPHEWIPNHGKIVDSFVSVTILYFVVTVGFKACSFCFWLRRRGGRVL